ncbi:hypothetical protein OHS71_03010 [Streptomyces sp. NBC_00377]|uniref:hypothetical protein n=1 Tax=unclassified Streptomyces TaxID=2593676 RepID=UPI002E1CAB89|nr:MULTISPECIES: hypothetical protein [unclassified Streptomyces]
MGARRERSVGAVATRVHLPGPAGHRQQPGYSPHPSRTDVVAALLAEAVARAEK